MATFLVPKQFNVWGCLWQYCENQNHSKSQRLFRNRKLIHLLTISLRSNIVGFISVNIKSHTLNKQLRFYELMLNPLLTHIVVNKQGRNVSANISLTIRISTKQSGVT